MRYIRQLRGSLTQSFNEKSLGFNLILREFMIGFAMALIIGAVAGLSSGQINGLINVFLGFAASYFLFVDTALHLFKNIKKLSIVRINLTVIKDLLIVLFFFIIAYKFIEPDFVFVAVGITITPVSAAVLLLISEDIC